MPLAKRPRREPTDDWQQLRVFVASPEQQAYELLRPIVLFGETPAERARETGVPERTLRRKADGFDAAGMASLFEALAVPPDDRRTLSLPQHTMRPKHRDRVAFFPTTQPGVSGCGGKRHIS